MPGNGLLLLTCGSIGLLPGLLFTRLLRLLQAQRKLINGLTQTRLQAALGFSVLTELLLQILAAGAKVRQRGVGLFQHGFHFGNDFLLLCQLLLTLGLLLFALLILLGKQLIHRRAEGFPHGLFLLAGQNIQLLPLALQRLGLLQGAGLVGFMRQLFRQPYQPLFFLLRCSRQGLHLFLQLLLALAQALQ